MKNEIEMSDYADRLGRVIVYLHDHLDETDLDLNKLAEIACMSPYHWHRIYQAIQGETLASTVKRLRLLRAAGYLAQTTMPISRIARKSGYPNVQSFTRVFRSVGAASKVNWGAQILSVYAAPTELARNFLWHSYKDFAPTEHVTLWDLCALLFWRVLLKGQVNCCVNNR